MKRYRTIAPNLGARRSIWTAPGQVEARFVDASVGGRRALTVVSGLELRRGRAANGGMHRPVFHQWTEARVRSWTSSTVRRPRVEDEVALVKASANRSVPTMASDCSCDR